MKTTQANTPSQVEDRILSLIEQMMDVVPKGTALGLCDLISAMLSGYFIESGGAVMPAVEAFLRQEVEDEEERAARSRRAAKALTYGSYNLKELIDKLREIVEEEGVWKPIIVQGYRVGSCPNRLRVIGEIMRNPVLLAVRAKRRREMPECLIQEVMLLLLAWLITSSYRDWQLIKRERAKRQARRPKVRRGVGKEKKGFEGVTKNGMCQAY